MDWQAAVAKIDAAKLTPAAKNDLQTLQATIAANQKQLDADALTMAQVLPVVPFAAKMVPIIDRAFASRTSSHRSRRRRSCRSSRT